MLVSGPCTGEEDGELQLPRGGVRIAGGDSVAGLGAEDLCEPRALADPEDAIEGRVLLQQPVQVGEGEVQVGVLAAAMRLGIVLHAP